AACAGGAADTSALSSISAMSVPTSTVSSACTRIFTRRPARGEGSSAVILSVMTSARASSFSTVSPSCLSQAPIVPSATVSPSRGILTGVGIHILLFSSLEADGHLAQVWIDRSVGLPWGHGHRRTHGTGEYDLSLEQTHAKL